MNILKAKSVVLNKDQVREFKASNVPGGAVQLHFRSYKLNEARFYQVESRPSIPGTIKRPCQFTDVPGMRFTTTKYTLDGVDGYVVERVK